LDGVILDSTEAPTELTRGAVFMLVTSLALAVVYHPASGSLIYGPTNLFWRFSLISTLFETCVILAYLTKSVISSIRWRYLDNLVEVLRDFAYSVMVARALNASKDRRDRGVSFDPDNISEQVQFGIEIASEMNMGFRWRIGIALPILAQFLKIMVLKGAYFPKVIGCIFFIHWITVELLLFVAGTSRSAFSPRQQRRIVDNVRQLLNPVLEPDSCELLERPLLKIHVAFFIVSGLVMVATTGSFWVS
jgi:hypothetical protein